jgi:hypothetical protein
MGDAYVKGGFEIGIYLGHMMNNGLSHLEPMVATRVDRFILVQEAKNGHSIPKLTTKMYQKGTKYTKWS